MRLALTPINAAILSGARVGGAPSLDAQIAAIYAAGRLGPWFDVSDLSTMYTTRAGMTNVGTPGDGTAHFVGRMEDKSLGRVLGPEQITNGGADTDAAWGKGAGWSISGGKFVKSAGADGYITQAAMTVGKWYRVTFSVDSLSGSNLLLAFGTGNVVATITTSGSYSYTLLCASSGTFGIYGYIATVASIDNISVRELPGYHALAANDTTARPQLSARVNALLHSEQLDNAVWTKIATTVSPNATTAPNGELTADLLIPTAVSAAHFFNHGGSYLGAGLKTCKFWAKAGGYPQVGFKDQAVSGAEVVFRLSGAGSVTNAVAGSSTEFSHAIESVGDGWYLCTVQLNTTGVMQNRIYPLPDAYTNANLNSYTWTGDGSSGVYIWGQDARFTNIHAAGSIPPYQRVVDPETYDSVGFPNRLIPNGTGQALQTSTITPGTDSVTVGFGIRKNSDAITAALMELTNGTGVNGAMLVLAPNSPGANTIGWAPRGTVAAATLTQSSIVAPITLTGIASAVISTDARSLTINGGTPTTSAADLGAGNFATDVLNLFSRNAASLWFGGQFFCDVVMFGPQLTAGELATVEAWINSKTKAP